MAGAAPKSRNWHAHENVHKPRGLHLFAAGDVQVGATNLEPRLTESPERNPKNLGLHLTIESLGGVGADVMVWKRANFHKVVKAGQYDHVIVRWDVEQIANFPVHDDRELAAHADAAMKALNAQHAAKGKPAKPTGKKPAAKKAAPKKKPAPKPKKKAAKSKKAKKAKKSLKKAAKKSGLKRLVRRLVKKLSPAKKKKR